VHSPAFTCKQWRNTPSSLRSSLPSDSVKIFSLIYILKDLKIRAFAST
jgi:hypothetical protein